MELEAGGEGVAIVGDKEAALAQEPEVAHLFRRQPVDIDEADRPIRAEAQQPGDPVFKYPGCPSTSSYSIIRSGATGLF